MLVQYMDIEGIAVTITHDMVSGKDEGQTRAAWDDILHRFFSEHQFITGAQLQLGSGMVNLVTSIVVREPTVRRQKFFVLVECKAPGNSTFDSTWQGDVDQLKGYFVDLDRSRRENTPMRKFGAVANGKNVRFYEWLAAEEALIDFGDGRSLYIDRECQDVMAMLKEIKKIILS